ncbi:MAG: DNA gyrase inhibitor YacG [Desulfuromonas sp.]|nr:DNA gyrase inhibitor YacG [Desulfuromonas sp.]
MQVNCPTCKKQSRWQDNRWRPFCSERCKMIDLGCWADEDYRIVGAQVFIEEETEETF